MMINFALFFPLLSVTKVNSDNINNYLDKAKIFGQKYLPISLLNLYRIYTYNFSIDVAKQPLDIVHLFQLLENYRVALK